MIPEWEMPVLANVLDLELQISQNALTSFCFLGIQPGRVAAFPIMLFLSSYSNILSRCFSVLMGFAQTEIASLDTIPSNCLRASNERKGNLQKSLHEPGQEHHDTPIYC